MFSVDYKDDFILANKLADKIKTNKLYVKANEIVALLKKDKVINKNELKKQN